MIHISVHYGLARDNENSIVGLFLRPPTSPSCNNQKFKHSINNSYYIVHKTLAVNPLLCVRY